MRKEAEKKNNIFLTGFMCGGKTSVGKELARLLGMKFTDTDSRFHSEYGIRPARFIARYGLKEFRRKEAVIVRRAAGEAGQVIALGGGVNITAKKWTRARNGSTVVFIDCGEQELFRRITADRELKKRPLLNSAKDLKGRISALLGRRRPGYENADITVLNSGRTARATALDIKRNLSNTKGKPS